MDLQFLIKANASCPTLTRARSTIPHLKIESVLCIHIEGAGLFMWIEEEKRIENDRKRVHRMFAGNVWSRLRKNMCV